MIKSKVNAMTILIKVNAKQPEPELIGQAADVIRNGGLVAFPTETVYGLGANALDERAVRSLFKVKNRPAIDPLIVHLAHTDDLEKVVQQVTDLAKVLAEAFWPGPLTLIQWKRAEVSTLVTSGLDTLATRVPAHPVALALLEAAGVPVVAPSANLFGRSSPTSANHVLKDLGGHIDMVLDGGLTPIGVESTVLDITTDPPVILRPGGLSREELEVVIGKIEIRSENAVSGIAQRSPGMLAKHYAPRAELVLCSGSNPEEVYGKIEKLACKYLNEGKKMGLLLADEDVERLSELDVYKYSLGSQDKLEEIAHRLYAGLRFLDEQGVDLILTRYFGEVGLGLAIRDRLNRAATRIE